MPYEPEFNLKLPKKLAAQIYYHYEPSDEEATGETLLRVYGAGLVLKNPEYGESNIHTSSSFEYIIEGKGFVEIGGIRHEVKAGDCVVTKIGINERITKSYGSSAEDPYVKMWFTARGRFVDSLFDAYGVKDHVTVKKVNLYPVFEKFLSNLQTNGYSFSFATHTILDIMNAMFSGKVQIEESENSLIEQVKNYITSKIQTRPSAASTASAFGMSEREFLNFFKKNFSVSYSKYIANERIELAKRTLENTNMSVTEIAQTLGYCDQSYFSASFRKKFGCYPAEYRKKSHGRTGDY